MKILCIGMNYARHIAELDNKRPEEPVVFMKSDSSLLQKNRPFYIPTFSNDLHHEIELVVKIDKLGKNISQKYAHRYYSSIGLGIDFTARDLQSKLRKQGHPWEKAKAFDHSAVISEEFIPVNELDMDNIDFRLEINGEIRQQGNSSQMIFKIDEIIEHLSSYFTLKIGDLLYTGTPEGVGSVKINDRLQGYIGNKLMFDFLVK